MNSPHSAPDISGFEGPEKILEIVFDVPTSSEGLRSIPRSEWDEILSLAHCAIVDYESNNFFDSYILSESSLFVYPQKLLIKTCGTTTLLKVIPRLKDYAKNNDHAIKWVCYSRKNFIFPQNQKSPHKNFSEEVRFLEDELLDGEAYILGPVTSDHWFCYVSDQLEEACENYRDVTMNLMMYDMDKEVAKQFYKDDDYTNVDDVTSKSGIGDLLPGSKIHAFMFDPCGYSMNGLKDNYYWTIHVTPESHCSYVSFETNMKMKDYNQLIQKVLEVFKPGRFTLSFFADENGLKDLSAEPYRNNTFTYPESGKLYYRTNVAMTNITGGYINGVGNFICGTSEKEAQIRGKKHTAKCLDMVIGEL